MTDDELRSLVRDAIARHLGPHSGASMSADVRVDSDRDHDTPLWRAHTSFGKFLSLPGDDQPGACLIEPTVACNHCGFCKSYGH